MPKLAREYLKKLTQRKKKSRVYYPFQSIGLALARILEDESHKSLYIKLAKQYDNQKLLRIARSVAERKKIKNKGGYFMAVLFKELDKAKIYTIKDEFQKKFLTTKTKPFDFNQYSKKEIREIVNKMRKIMVRNDGVGLSANQIGIPYSFFVALLPYPKEKPKFYAIFNPRIVAHSKEKELMLEGCLSIPGTWGLVERYKKVTLEGLDKNQKSIKIKAQGLLAQIFQHEVDHLNGILFTSKAKKILTKESLEKIKNKKL